MKCPICSNTATQPAHPRSFDKDRRAALYVVHPAYGVPLDACPACKTAYVHFVHPDILPIYRSAGGTGWAKAAPTIAGSDPTLHEAALTTERQRVMYFSCGGIENAERARALAPEVVVADPIFVGPDGGPLKKVNAMTLGAPQFVGAFDAILVDQSFTFLSMPYFWLTLMSRLLRPEGIVSFCLPVVNHEAVRGGAYDIRTILFPQPESWQKLFALVPTLRVDDISVSESGMLSARLTNLRTYPQAPAMSIEPAELVESLQTNSMTCFFLRMGMASIGAMGNKMQDQQAQLENEMDHP